MEYQELNAEIINKWCQEGWEWGQPITHEIYENAKKGLWGVYLTPTKLVPKEWFGDLQGKKLLGLASGGGQQMPVFTALGAVCTVLDYSGEQCRSEKIIAEREGYSIEIIQEDMSKKLPFDDESFDIIFHPVSNCYVEKVDTIFKDNRKNKKQLLFSATIWYNKTQDISYRRLKIMAEDRNTYKIHDNGSLGEVQIADEVVAIIAGLAATEVEGVGSMAGNITNELVGKLGMKNLSKGVKVDVLEDVVCVDLALNIEYGFNILETSKRVQERVKAAIENMTGLTVSDVNVRIASVEIDKVH